MGLIYHAAMENSLIMCFMDSRLWNALGMHQNENSWPKPNKMKHWPNTEHVFSKKFSPK